MDKGRFPVERLAGVETPFYYYDSEVLSRTIEEAKKGAEKCGARIHYAVKANANKGVLRMIAAKGLGADCVSGNEVRAAIEAGIRAEDVVFAGVGKTDKEIAYALEAGIKCFNAESLPELEAIDALAREKGKVADVCLRVNPNVDAHTHAYITTGLSENKFGFNMEDLDEVVGAVKGMKGLRLVGVHFHIGSQITEFGCFELLCERVNEIVERMEAMGVEVRIVNVGGGLGIDYENPNGNPVPRFGEYFGVFAKGLKLKEGQEVHCELGRSLVGQCGSLITRVTYVKKGKAKQFAIVDAGMTDLIRPALYQAYHKIENITSERGVEKYDVVGPICESSDVFQKECELNGCERGDLLALRSAGAYGEIMASGYNLRALPKGYMSEEL